MDFKVNGIMPALKSILFIFSYFYIISNLLLHHKYVNP